jgi:cyanophycinase
MRADILAVGGAEDKENEKQILWDFLRRAGGNQAILAIIPAASGIPEVLGNLYRNIFVDMGADPDQVRILDIRNPADARHPEALELVRHCTGIYFTGGDQERLSEVLMNTELMELIQQRCLQGETVIAGTSAGASALGHHMISRGYSGESPTPAIVTVKNGLGILPTLIVDQHFHQRNRLVRLITAVTYYPHCLGLGIDEDTAAIIHADNTLDVIGTGSVTLVDGSHIQSDLQQTPSDQNYCLLNARLHFLSPGSRFDLDTMKLL